MDYKKVYNQLIEYAKQNPPTEYKEQHHIVPKAEGGSDDKNNLVKLTARQHYIAHLLLAKIYDDYAMYSALTYMQTGRNKNRKFKFNSRLYEKMREEFGRKHSQHMKGRFSGEKHWNYGNHLSDEAKENKDQPIQDKKHGIKAFLCQKKLKRNCLLIMDREDKKLEKKLAKQCMENTLQKKPNGK